MYRGSFPSTMILRSSLGSLSLSEIPESAETLLTESSLNFKLWPKERKVSVTTLIFVSEKFSERLLEIKRSLIIERNKVKSDWWKLISMISF